MDHLNQANTDNSARKPLPELAHDLFDQGRQMGRDEMKFAQTELRLALRQISKAAVYFAIALAGGIAVLSALDDLLRMSLVSWGITPLWSSAIAFGVLLVVAGGFVWRGFTLAKRAATAPKTILNKFSADVRSLKEIFK
ncbi:hypothetical protein BFP70_12345 [Thioclava sp. SK-1]|uniref:phage holin family protein n=1 Tax=Thioclava sp. SK-1 TaxID=1889770 RepID=UPI0008253896|nr:phage holin family protein [Thioclava sp. SK-1]OCX63433.1 hypothetical protein BFP70_12345 [Thioclava sp. SK-1]